MWASKCNPVLANWWQSCVGCVDFSQCRSNYGLAFITVEYFPAVFFHICLGNQQSFEQGNQLASRWNTSYSSHSILLWTFLAVVLPGKWRPYIVLAIGKIKCTVGKYLYYKYTCMYYSLSRSDCQRRTKYLYHQPADQGWHWQRQRRRLWSSWKQRQRVWCWHVPCGRPES